MNRDEGGPLCEDSEVLGVERNADGHALVARVQTWASDNFVPLNASIELTQRCNIRCLHCYNFDRDEPKRANTDCTAPELSDDEILGVMKDLRDAGCLFLMLTGGEVLSHPRLFTFLDRARELNFAVQLLTNGTMLQPGVAAKLAAYRNLQGVSVSLYGATPETHDFITQMPGSWRRTWDGAKRLQHLGVVVRLKFITMKQNAHEVEAMMAQATEAKLHYMIDFNITPRHDGSRTSLDTRIELDQLEGLYRGPLRPLVTTKRTPVSDETFHCNCARGNVAITSTGEVQPCISVPWSAGNIRQRPFGEIWSSSEVFQKIRGLKMADYAKCAPCDSKEYCRRDRASALITTGDYTSADPFTCATTEIARRVAEDAGDERLYQVRRAALAR